MFSIKIRLKFAICNRASSYFLSFDGGGYIKGKNKEKFGFLLIKNFCSIKKILGIDIRFVI